jgi:hypothetical protein
MKDAEALTCWSCQVHSVIARLRHKPFRLCTRCAYKMRQAQNGWTAWGQTVAGASSQSASNSPDRVRPSAPRISGIASPSGGAPTLDVRKASPVKMGAVEWRD